MLIADFFDYFKIKKATILVFLICDANLRIKDENLKKSAKDAI